MKMSKDRVYWYVRYKVLDVKIKGLNKAWKVENVPWYIISKIDNKRIKGLAWDDPKVAPMMRRAVNAVDREIKRTKRLLPMARKRSDCYIKFLLAK